MANNYGNRYLTVDQFVKYCKDLNVETDNRELEYYEQVGIMFSVALLVYPEDYVRLSTLRSLGVTSDSIKRDQWPDLQRLFDKPRIIPEHYADLDDDELIDSFDREMGNSPYLYHPTLENYKSWDSYNILIPYRDGQQLFKSIAEHFYGYWQVHQLYYIQQYPDLYKNKFLLENITDEIKRRYFLPRAPNLETLREFKGLAHMFDALSFWITLSGREHNRTFALIPVEHQVKHLDATQIQAYLDRLTADGKLVQARYGITIDELYGFLGQLMNLYEEYRKEEHYKLAEELRNDIYFHTQFIETLSGNQWEAIAEELGKRYTFWTKQAFLHLNILAKEHDDALELLTNYGAKYGVALGKLNILRPKRIFSSAEIGELVDFCEREGFSVLLTALSGMVSTQEEYAEKFRRVTRYTNLKNVLTALEFLLKDFAGKGGIIINKQTMNPMIQGVMKNETTWFPLYEKKNKNKITSAKNPAEFFNKLIQLLHDPELVQSEDAYWARVFLIASLARNLTVHAYPNDDWFYGELFGEMLQAAIYAILYSWQLAKREGWT